MVTFYFLEMVPALALMVADYIIYYVFGVDKTVLVDSKNKMKQLVGAQNNIHLNMSPAING